MNTVDTTEVPEKANDAGSAPAARLLRLPEVCLRTGMSKAWIYDAMSRGLFPRPVRIGIRAVAWTEDELEQWQERLRLAIRR